MGIVVAAFAHRAPSRVLFFLDGIGIFLVLQPKAKPICVSLLRHHSIPWLYQEMRGVVHQYKLYRPPKARQRCKPFPLGEHARSGGAYDPDRRMHAVDVKPRRSLNPRFDSASKRNTSIKALPFLLRYRVVERDILKISRINSVLHSGGGDVIL